VKNCCMLVTARHPAPTNAQALDILTMPGISLGRWPCYNMWTLPETEAGEGMLFGTQWAKLPGLVHFLLQIGTCGD
jgi:hypothetical protein